MVIEREIKIAYICEICGRVWFQKHLAEHCEGLCESGNPIQIHKKELERRAMLKEND